MKATAKFKTPPPSSRRVALNMSEKEAEMLRSILGQSNCDVHGLEGVYNALVSLFPHRVPAAAGWAIRNEEGRIVP